MKKLIIACSVFVLLVAGAYRWYSLQQPVEVVVSDSIQDIVQNPKPIPTPTPQVETDEKKELNEEAYPETPNVEDEVMIEREEEAPIVDDLDTEQVTISARHQLPVPFIVQAPFGNWELPYKEACEEASVLMLHNYNQGIYSLTQDQMKEQLDQIAAWEIEQYQDRIHSSTEETAEYLLSYLGYAEEQISIIYDYTVDDLKALIDAGYPILVPSAGRLLDNVNFRDPGPIYHMLVITGYDQTYFYTNDPGTRNGEGYKYKHDVLYNAIHDLTPDLEEIETGRKALIIIKDL